LFLVVFLMVAILTGMKWNFSVVLICISFMDRDSTGLFSSPLILSADNGRLQNLEQITPP
jgi:hypothetical protein